MASKHALRWIALVLAGAGLLACAPMLPPAGLFYTGVQSNRQFDAGASSAAPGRLVYGEACTHGVMGLAAWGDASLDAALEKANALGRTLKNITIDHSQTNIFLFYMEYCTIVKAYVVENREERALREERESTEHEALESGKPEAVGKAQKSDSIPPTPTPTINAVHTP